MPIIVQSPTPTDEDGTPSIPLPSISRRRSRLERWIDDQHTHTDGEDLEDGLARGSSPKSYPYLAYSDMRRARSASCDDDSGSISESFVLVEAGDGTGSSCRQEPNIFDEVRAYPHVIGTVMNDISLTRLQQAPPLFGFGTPQGTRSYTSLLCTPPSLRGFRFSLSPSRRPSPSPYDSSPSLGHDDSFCPHSLSMGRHGRTTSDGSLAPPELQNTPSKSSPSATSSPRSRGPWSFKRPSVLGTFTPAASDVSIDEGSALHLSPPRPSFSSSLTFSSGTTGASTNPSTPNIGSPSSASSARSKAPHHSLWSLPPDATHLHDPPNAETSVLIKPGTLRLPFSFKTSGKGLRHVPTMLPISREKRKKKLVVSGIAKGDQARLEAFRKWCEVGRPRIVSMGNTLTRFTNHSHSAK